jgi:hypothetical protein
MATRRPNPAAIAAARRVHPSAPELAATIRRARRGLEELEALATQLPAELAPPCPEKAAGTLRGAERVLEKWSRVMVEATRRSR